MASIAAALGLRASQSGLPIPSRGPQYLLFHFVFAYVITTSRHMKQALRIDDNVSPRQDISSTGEEAVKSGKITRKQLDMIKRNDAAHHNSMENYPLLIAAILAAQQAGLPNTTINKAALWYTGARIAYVAAYILIDSWYLSLIRSVAWWVGNISCLRLLWKAGKKLSS